ncbi:hypothetical protein ACTFIT_002132 [Dictyostelium discoideum]
MLYSAMHCSSRCLNFAAFSNIPGDNIHLFLCLCRMHVTNAFYINHLNQVKPILTVVRSSTSTKLVSYYLTPQAKISINGKTTRKFDIKRGVKQGDPISATLFVIVIEILARTINADNTIIGLPQIKIKFTQFADDSTTYNITYEQQQQSIKHFK